MQLISFAFGDVHFMNSVAYIARELKIRLYPFCKNTFMWPGVMESFW